MAAIFHSRSCQYRVQKSCSLQCALGLFYFHLACCDSAVLTGFGSGALRFTWRGCFKARKGNILQQDCEGSVSSLTAGHQPRRSILLRDFWLTRACSGLSTVRLVQIARWSTNDVSGFLASYFGVGGLPSSTPVWAEPRRSSWLFQAKWQQASSVSTKPVEYLLAWGHSWCQLKFKYLWWAVGWTVRWSLDPDGL